jgi:hypothetical protein
VSLGLAPLIGLAAAAASTTWWLGARHSRSCTPPRFARPEPDSSCSAGKRSRSSAWLDDLRGLSAPVRLAAHAIATGATVLARGPFALPEPLDSLAVALTGLVSALWVTGFLNAFNFMDGTDGIAGVQALVGAAARTLVGWWHDALP